MQNDEDNANRLAMDAWNARVTIFRTKIERRDALCDFIKIKINEIEEECNETSLNKDQIFLMDEALYYLGKLKDSIAEIDI